jgi:chaperonin GroES
MKKLADRVEAISKWNAMEYKVYGAKVAIIRDEAPDTTEGGSIIPDTAKAKMPVGTIIAIGTIMEDEGLDYGFKPGDRVMFSKYGGTSFEVKVPGDTLLVELVHIKDIYVGWEGEEQ